MNEFYLDLNIFNLYGWEENSKSFDKISQMIDQIEKGDDFPAVPVRRIGRFSYSIVLGVKKEDCIFMEDGGHHRAIAHYIANVPLKCRLYSRNPAPKNKISIREISLSF